MSWLAPGFLLWGAGAIVVLAAVHLLARRRPPAEELPTARFVPPRALRITSRSLAPSDALLFLLRALALVAIASAFAAPIVRRTRSRVMRVVAVDRSRAVASASELRDSVRAVLRDGDALVAFDSVARRVPAGDVDSVATTDGRGSLSAGLLGASRAAGAVAPRADSLELVVVSPLVAEEVDDAVMLARAAWPGRARVVRVAGRSADTLPHTLEVEAGDDPLVAALRLRGPRGAGATARVRRSAPSAADSAWARERGHVLVVWPAHGAAGPPGWGSRVRLDTSGAVVAGEAVVVAPLVRSWTLQGRVVARWGDGEPAAVEHSIGDGCIRDVGIGFDAASDFPFRPEVVRLTTELLAPCGGARDLRPVSDSVVARIAGAGPLATAGAFPAPPDRRSPLTLWLLLSAFVLLVVEWAVRRDVRGGTT